MMESVPSRYLLPIAISAMAIVALLLMDFPGLAIDLTLFSLGMQAANLLWERAERRKCP